MLVTVISLAKWRLNPVSLMSITWTKVVVFLCVNKHKNSTKHNSSILLTLTAALSEASVNAMIHFFQEMHHAQKTLTPLVIILSPGSDYSCNPCTAMLHCISNVPQHVNNISELFTAC